MIKALLGPYQELGFVPTGGINPHNLLDYLAIPQVLACGGSWMVPESAIRQADWAQITRLAQEAVNLVLGLKLRRIGLYHKNAQDAQDSARSLSLLTGWPLVNTSAGQAQVGEAFEILQENGQGS